MRIKYTIDISDRARNYLSREQRPRAKKRLATRQEVIDLFDLFVSQIEKCANENDAPPEVATIKHDPLVDTRSSYQRGSDQVRDRFGLPRVDTGR